MKKCFFLFTWLMLALCLFVASCDDDKEEQIPALDLVVDNSVVTLLQGDRISVRITSGNGGYSVKPFDESLATAEVVDDVVTIAAVEDSDLGEDEQVETTVLVIDSRKKVAKVQVRIAKLWELAADVPEEGLEMFIGEIAAVRILTGNGDYRITQPEGDEQYLELGELSGQVFNVRALMEGETSIRIADKKEKELTIPVLVKIVELTLDTDEVRFVEPDSSPVTVKIEKGNGGYTFAYSQEGIVEAAESDNVITLTPKQTGETVVTVRDQKGSTAEIAVKVGSAQLKTDASDGLVIAGFKASGTISILKGNGGYQLGELSEADKQIISATLDGDKVTVQALGQFGTATLTILDASGSSVEIPVTVSRLATDLGSDYCFFVDIRPYVEQHAELKSLKQVTYEIFFYPTYSRSLMSFIGLEGNFLLRLSGDGDINQKFEIATMIYKNGVSGDKYNDPRFRSEQTMYADRSDMGQLNPGRWYHIAVVFDATQPTVKEAYRMYINGVRENLTAMSDDYANAAPNQSIDLSQFNNDPGLMIGRSNNDRYRLGYINLFEARVWTTARTEDQIIANMESLHEDSYAEGDLLAHWIFSDGVETDKFEDRTGHGLDAKVCEGGERFNKDATVFFPLDRYVPVEWPVNF